MQTDKLIEAVAAAIWGAFEKELYSAADNQKKD